MSTVQSNSADGELNHFERASLETYSGQDFSLSKPEASKVKAVDIAHALGYTCRYGGHVNTFYSVAEHSVLVYRLLRKQKYNHGLCIAGLMHDAAEAYMGDMIAPVKWLEKDSHPGGMSSSEITFMEQRIDCAIAERFKLSPIQNSSAVKLADLWALRIEVHKLTASKGEGWRWTDEVLELGLLPDDVEWVGGLGPAEAGQQMYMLMHDIGLVMR